MRPAADDPYRRLGSSTHGDRFRFVSVFDDERATVNVTEVIAPHDRDVDDTQDRFVAAYQCDVDGKLAVALDEFLCAVKRIDEPEYRPAGSLRDIDGSGFFRPNGNIGCQLR